MYLVFFSFRGFIIVCYLEFSQITGIGKSAFHLVNRVLEKPLY